MDIYIIGLGFRPYRHKGTYESDHTPVIEWNKDDPSSYELYVNTLRETIEGTAFVIHALVPLSCVSQCFHLSGNFRLRKPRLHDVCFVSARWVRTVRDLHRTRQYSPGVLGESNPLLFGDLDLDDVGADDTE